MAIILNIETSSTNCSVSIGKEGKLLSIIEKNDSGYSHSENLHVFIREALEAASIELTAINAVAVSKGPGSYTGLRIGVSSAKGLCFSLNKPLIAVDTLKLLAMRIKVKKSFIVPMIDARRMEVYTTVFNDVYHQITPTVAEIITSDSFKTFLDERETYFIGSGALKCKDIIKHPHAIFNEDMLLPSAKEMVSLSFEKYKTGDFEDVAYFEPYYLKDFVTTTKKS